jgi:transposase
MPLAAEAITLTTEERVELEQMRQSRTLSAGDVFRARLILVLAEGVSYRTIQERLDTKAPTISRWKERFLQQRMDGLIEIRHPGQKHP